MLFEPGIAPRGMFEPAVGRRWPSTWLGTGLLGGGHDRARVEHVTFSSGEEGPAEIV